MTPAASQFVGPTLLLAAFLAVLVLAVVKLGRVARASSKPTRDLDADSPLLSVALQQAIATLRAEQKATAARAAASERLNGQIVASLTSGVLLVNADRRIAIINPAARRILDVDEEMAPDALSLASFPSLGGVIGECLDNHTAVMRREVEMTRADGPRHLGVTVSLLVGDRGETQGAICLFSDLTRVMALEEQLRLKEALARLGELTAGLAHEFRNGLATIHGYSRLLDPRAFPDPERQYVEGLRTETDTLGKLVTDFLEFAKPEPLACRPVALRPVVESAAHDVDAGFEWTGQFETISGDDGLLRQAFNNLYRNSAEACWAAGIAPYITVEARADAANRELSVTVRDNGPGIGPDVLPRIFQPFFTTRSTGTGLGLAIVQRVVVSHNGRIVAGTHPDGGAVFTMTLPLATSREA